MALFGSKRDETPAPSTISDKDWRQLQDRALKANPPLRSLFSAESVRRSKDGAENYRNRGSN